MVSLAPPEPEQARPPQRGEVLTAPAEAGAPFTVRIPAFDEHHVFEIRYWMPRGEDLPAAGDQVLVLEDDKGEPWAVAWGPPIPG